jgi:hypothetical protein
MTALRFTEQSPHEVKTASKTESNQPAYFGVTRVAVLD